METDETITERVRTGEYFREARRAYSDVYVEPMADRYLYVIVTLASLVICLLAFFALTGLYPLNPPAPFVYISQDSTEELPLMKPISQPAEEPNLALKKYLVAEYVKRRESYDFTTLELNVRVVRNMSDDETYTAFERLLNPASPQSPIAKYERHTRRTVKILAIQPLADGSLDVTYDSFLERGRHAEPELAGRWRTNIAFRFDDVTVDQITGESSPLSFTVTRYSTQRIQA